MFRGPQHLAPNTLHHPPSTISNEIQPKTRAVDGGGSVVPVLIDSKQWWYLAGVAERRGATVSELLIAAVDSFMPDPEDPVVALWREGKPDRVIAAELGLTNRAVQAARKKAGLPARDGHRRAG